MGIGTPGNPLNLTFSVTNVCQSRCKTCNIWELYRKDPQKRKEELKIGEIRRIFRSMGHIYIFNMSGGEPFLRPDIVDVITLACKYLTPGVIHIPTNAIAADLAEQRIHEILDVIKIHDPSIQLTIKPSLDHIDERHDQIRGVPGNFKKVMRLFDRLKSLKSDYPNLHAELGTVISRWNVDDIRDIARFVTSLGVDSYRNEIAEQRSEMFNTLNSITPNPDQYAKAIDYFVRQIEENMKSRLLFQRITNAFRLVYYDMAIRILRENKQIVPCYAGISNAHLSPYGDIWACCTLGYEKSMGNLRDYDYDFQKMWRSQQAMKTRAYIRHGHCTCPLANQAYSNMLMNFPALLRVMRAVVTSN
jgi:MoaA/NifB/PqqE/SkfB family radical SAM enzyme